MDTIFDEIRDACRKVSDRSRYVRIAPDRIAAYASTLPLSGIRAPSLDPAHHYLGHGDGTLIFLLVLDSVNFGSGYFPHLQKLPGLSGYFTVATRLTDRFISSGPLTADELAHLTPEACASIFCQELDDAVRAELMALFTRALNDLGVWLLERFGGRPAGPIEAAGGSADRLVRLLAEMPYFQDVETYDDLAVPFYKRAQLTVADLALAFHGQGYGRFDDLPDLTIFADNLVPHVLRVDGILQYDDELIRAIDAGERIPAGSPQEVEIRAGALHAVELMAASLRAGGQDVTPMQLDYLLWNRGQQPAYKAIPRHRTRTVFY